MRQASCQMVLQLKYLAENPLGKTETTMYMPDCCKSLKLDISLQYIAWDIWGSLVYPNVYLEFYLSLLYSLSALYNVNKP